LNYKFINYEILHFLFLTEQNVLMILFILQRKFFFVIIIIIIIIIVPLSFFYSDFYSENILQ